MKKSLKTPVVAAALAALLALPLQAQASFTGQNVTLSYQLPHMPDATFNTLSAIVSADPVVEFLGSATDTFGQKWDFSIDIRETSIVYGWTESTRANEPNGGNIGAAQDTWRFDLTFSGGDLPDMKLTGFTTAGMFGASSPNILLYKPAPDTLHAGFGLLASTDVYTVSAVPEADTWAMLLAGLGLMGSVARRRHRR